MRINSKTTQKLVSFKSKKKDFDDLKKELSEGWYVANIRLYNGTFLCVLEKSLELDNQQNISNQQHIAQKLNFEQLFKFKKNKDLTDA